MYLDGHESHVQVEFLEACWDINIVVVCLPASMSSISQPLDVTFFNLSQNAYKDQVRTYQLGLTIGSASRGMFCAWLQTAWEQTATERHIRAAWKDAGLWPLNTLYNYHQTTSPPPFDVAIDPVTPQTIRTFQMID